MKTTYKQIEDAIRVGSELGTNFILTADSYKTTHWKMLPKDGEAFFSYIEARKANDFTIFAGLQRFVMKYLSIPITGKMIDEAEKFISAHIGPSAFNRADWEYLVYEYHGYIPVTIKAVKEGSCIPTKNVLLTVECEDSRLFWLASYIETSLQRAVWYPTTVATNSFKAKDIIKRAFALTHSDSAGIDFTLHDFGGRGVTSEESAQIGALAHMFVFKGSDTMSGINAANIYYFDQMAGFSVHASEHSVACSFGDDFEGECEYIEQMLSIAEPNMIVSVVADAQDVFRFVDIVTTKYLDTIIDKKCKFVFRPDSGEPVQVLTKIFQIIEKNLHASEVIAKHGNLISHTDIGYKLLPSFLGVLQGDGVDNPMIQRILDSLYNHGWAASNMVFGSGGGLLQKLDRDTYKFAQKGSAIKRSGKWIPIAKNPITDPGKVSKKGRLTLIKSESTGEYETVVIDDYSKIPHGWYDALEVVYSLGTIERIQSLSEIREIVESELKKV